MHQRIKLRLRDWLKELIDAGLYGLKWEGQTRGSEPFEPLGKTALGMAGL